MDRDYLKLRAAAFAWTVPVTAVLAVQPVIWWCNAQGIGWAGSFAIVALAAFVVGVVVAALIEAAKVLRFGLSSRRQARDEKNLAASV